MTQDQTSRVEDISRRKSGTRTDIDSDEPSGSAGRGTSSLPGVEAFGAISHIAPFMALTWLYANALYRHKTPEARQAQFTADHRWLVRAAFVGDLALRLLLVALIFLVIVKGVAPLPWVQTDQVPQPTGSAR